MEKEKCKCCTYFRPECMCICHMTEESDIEKLREVLYELLAAIEDGTVDAEQLGEIRRKITEL